MGVSFLSTENSYIYYKVQDYHGWLLLDLVQLLSVELGRENTRSARAR